MSFWPLARSADRKLADEYTALIREQSVALHEQEVALEASRQRNRGLIAEVTSLRMALGQAQTLIASGLPERNKMAAALVCDLGCAENIASMAACLKSEADGTDFSESLTEIKRLMPSFWMRMSAAAIGHFDHLKWGQDH
jgi:hypothetical protein